VGKDALYHLCRGREQLAPEVDRSSVGIDLSPTEPFGRGDDLEAGQDRCPPPR